MTLTGGGPDTFDIIAKAHMRDLTLFCPIEPHHNVLEVGCGIGRDAIPLTDILDRSGRYLGIDIIKDSIDWCSDHISARHPNFSFVHFDVRDQLHNPHGRSSTLHMTIPLPDRSVDRIILWSVFTHMTFGDIVHYLREFARVLKPTGKVFATWFVVNDAILAAARRESLTPFNLRFEHHIARGCYINDLKHPMGAVAYTAERLHRAVRASGLAMVGEILPGAWSGYFEHPKGGQDATVLERGTKRTPGFWDRARSLIG